METLPSEVHWKIMTFMRHPVAEVFHHVVVKAFTRELDVMRWDISYDSKHCDLRWFERCTLYDFFKENKHDIKSYDKLYNATSSKDDGDDDDDDGLDFDF